MKLYYVSGIGAGGKKVERGSLQNVAGPVGDAAAREELATSCNSQTYDFCGKHLIASYSACRMDRLEDKSGVDEIMRRAVAASGATVVDAALHVFPGAGMTYVYVLAESHASIHTYPEHASCFVDIFTCGYECDPLRFDAVLTEYFEPEKVSRQLIMRGDVNSVALDEKMASRSGESELNFSLLRDISVTSDSMNSG